MQTTGLPGKPTIMAQKEDEGGRGLAPVGASQNGAGASRTLQRHDGGVEGCWAW